MPLCYTPGVLSEMCVEPNAAYRHEEDLLSEDTLMKFTTAFTFIVSAVLLFLFTTKGF